MKAYLPEWKIYLWKKLLLDESSPERVFQPADYIYFDQNYGQSASIASAQQNIDRLNNQKALAITSGKKMKIDSGAETPHSDQYYNFDPREVMLALIDLAEEKPECLDIEDIELRQDFIVKYRRKRSVYLALEEKKRLASIPSSRAIYHVNTSQPDNRFTDPFCGLSQHIYKKVEKDEKLTLSEFKALILNKPDESIYPSIHFKARTDKKNLLLRLHAYIADFVAGDLIPHQGARLFKFEQQKNNILGAIKSLTATYGDKNLAITFAEVARCGGWEGKDEHHYRFYETLLALEKMGELEITGLRKDEVILSLVAKLPVNEKVLPQKELSLADQKKLFILEKLKEEWDLAPKNRERVEIRISGKRVYGLIREIGIDHNQLRNILSSFEEENVILDHRFINPAM